MRHAVRSVFAKRIGLRHIAPLITLLSCMLMIVRAADTASDGLFWIDILAVDLHLEV